MRLRLLSFIILLLIWSTAVRGQNTSCLDDFGGVQASEPETTSPNHDEDSINVMAWYGECIVVGWNDGLWLFDPNEMDNPIQIIRIENKVINNLAVNPEDMTIAFTVTQEPIAYLINSYALMRSVMADGQVVTDISFSSDGSLMAVASSDVEEGFYFGARVQIWNHEGEIISAFPTFASLVPQVFISTDNRGLVTHKVEPGYLGDEAAIWGIGTRTKLWSHDDVLHDTRNHEDILVFSSMTMQGNIMALGGLYGFYNYNNFYGLGVHLWNVETQERLLKINGISGQSNWESAYEVPNLLLAFNTSGSVLATSTGDENIQLWDTHDGSQIGDIRVKASHIQQMTYGPDHLLAVMTEAGITIIDTESMSQITSFNLFKTP